MGWGDKTGIARQVRNVCASVEAMTAEDHLRRALATAPKIREFLDLVR